MGKYGSHEKYERNAEIVKRRNEGMTLRAIAKMYGVTAETVRQIIVREDRRKRYAQRMRETEGLVSDKPKRPVYMTMAQFLEQFGIIVRREGTLEMDFFKANEPMSEEMAKRLGVKPLEESWQRSNSSAAQ